MVRRQQQTSCLSLPTNVQSRILQQTALWHGTKRAKIEFQNRSQGWIQHNHSSGRDKKISDCLLLVLQIRLLSQNKPMLQSYAGMTAEGSCLCDSAREEISCMFRLNRSLQTQVTQWVYNLSGNTSRRDTVPCIFILSSLSKSVSWSCTFCAMSVNLAIYGIMPMLLPVGSTESICECSPRQEKLQEYNW